MNKKIIVVTFVLITMFTTMFNITSYALYANTDYKQIYLEYAKDADQTYRNKLNDAISGLILVDLNDDKVPEMLAFSTSVSYFDKDGNQVYAVNGDYGKVAYHEYSHTIDKAFSIVNGEVLEDSPWKQRMDYYAINMPFLPDEETKDTEEFSGVLKAKSGEKYFGTYVVNRGVVLLWYNEGGFDYSRGNLDNDFFDDYSPVDLPVASIMFYDDEKQYMYSKSEAMQLLLDKYESRSGASSHTNSGNSKNRVSDWAISEVNEAGDLCLIPEEMLSDDLTENITRAEFAAIAYRLYETIIGNKLNWHGGYIVDIEYNKYEDYIRGAYILGITKGTGTDGEGGVIFSPDLSITREQLATMLCRVIKRSKFEDWDPENDSGFPLDISNARRFDDDSNISDYAYESVYYMSKHGIVKGVDDSHFAPLDTATKEQAILLALRIYKEIEQLPVSGTQDENRVVAEGIRISEEKLNLYVGDTATLRADIIPQNAANQEIEWLSSNEDIVTVSQDGRIKAKRVGTAAINAQVQEGTSVYVAQCIVTVLSEDNNDYVFDNGTILKYNGSQTNVVVPKEINGQKVLRIGERAFYDNDHLKTVELPNGISGIEKKAFAMCSNLEDIMIPDSVVYIRDEAFWGCNKLKSFVFSRSMELIQKEVLATCTSLKSVGISDTIEEILPNAFYDCTALESITIPPSIKEIDYTAFTNCSNIKSVYYNGTKQEWEGITVKSDLNQYTASDLFPNAVIYCKKSINESEASSDDIATGGIRPQRPTVEVDVTDTEPGSTRPQIPTVEVDATDTEPTAEPGSTRPQRPTV